MPWYEAIGFAGTLFVLFSFFMKNVREIRIVNIAGAVLFVVYGLIIGAVSTWLLNGILTIVHIVYLTRSEK